MTTGREKWNPGAQLEIVLDCGQQENGTLRDWDDHSIVIEQDRVVETIPFCLVREAHFA